jgi:hypothetical protein
MIHLHIATKSDPIRQGKESKREGRYLQENILKFWNNLNVLKEKP